MARTATNPQTGDRIQYVNGQWVPIGKQTSSDRVNKQIKDNAARVKEPVEYEVSKSIENIPASAGKAWDDTVQAFMNPIDTITGLGQAAAGAVQKFHPDAMRQDYVPQAEAVGQHYSDRYGGLDQFKTTAMEDPVGMGLDALGLASFGGTALPKQLGAVGKVASALDPADLPFKAAGSLLDPASLYQSSAKIHSRFDTPRMQEAALREGILPTDAGIAKAQGIVEDVGSQIKSKIDAAIVPSKGAGATVPISRVTQGIKDLKKDVTYMDTDSVSNLAEVEKVVDDFKQMLSDEGKTALNPADAQLLKQKLYRKINWNREYQTGTPVGEQTLKSMALETKSALEDAIPGIKELNMRQADMIELQDALGVPASRIGRRDIIGIGTPIKAIAGQGAGGLPGMAAGATIGVFDSPHVKARVALGLDKIKGLKVSDARKRVMAIELMRNEAAMERENSE